MRIKNGILNKIEMRHERSKSINQADGKGPNSRTFISLIVNRIERTAEVIEPVPADTRHHEVKPATPANRQEDFLGGTLNHCQSEPQ